MTHGSTTIPSSLPSVGMHACNDFLFCFHLDTYATVGHPIIPDVKSGYVDVKRLFVEICTIHSSPTLEEVKDLCIDLIVGAMSDVPQNCFQYDIKNALTMNDLARIVCFHLSWWLNYDFFEKVVDHFQPALKVVKQRLKHYEDKLKHLLLQKLEYIAELQQR